MVEKWATIFLIYFIFTTVTDANNENTRVDGLIDNDPQDESSADVQAALQHYENGNITTYRGASSSSSSGGTLQLFRSANWGQSDILRSRIHASKILEPARALNPYVKNEREILQNTTKRKSLERDNLPRTNREYFRHDLHTAFRLPLQRLSDNQLTKLLQNYHNRVGKGISNVDYSKMEKSEKIRRLKSLIISRTGTESGRLQLIRPTLLTNVNVISENEINLNPPPSFTIGQNEIGERLTGVNSTTTNLHSTAPILETTTVPEHIEDYSTMHIATTSEKQEFHQKEIAELTQINVLEEEKTIVTSTKSTSIEDEVAKFKNYKESNEISYFANLLSEFKARYERIKALFKAKLQELNRKKALLAAHKEENISKMMDTNQLASGFSTTIDTFTNTDEISQHAEFVTTPCSDTELIKPNHDINSLKFKLFQPLPNQKLHDSSIELVSEQRTYPTELITLKARNLMLETISLFSTQPSITIENISNNTERETNTEIITLHTKTESSAPITDINLDTATTYTTTNTIIKEALDPFSDSTIAFEENTKDINNSAPSNKTIKDKNRLVKKLLGILQYVNKNKTQKATVPTPDLNSTTLIELLNNEARNDAEHEKINVKGQVTQSILKNPAPRAQVPKTFKTPEIDISPTNVIDTNDENVERAEIISTTNEGTADGPKIAEKGLVELSTIDLIKTLQTENKNRLHQTLERQNSDNNKPPKLDNDLICNAITCDFERGSLCEWEASEDAVLPNDRHYRLRIRRSNNIRNTAEHQFVQRTWHNWEGRYRNRLTGIARAQVFSRANRRFAAAYLKPNQRATLTSRIPSGERKTIRFSAWEATRDLRLRVCCDFINTDKERQCVFETKRGVRRGSRNWKSYTATCPADTAKVIFECVNDGLFQGACGIDNVHLLSDNCPNFTPIAGLHENRRMA